MHQSSRLALLLASTALCTFACSESENNGASQGDGGAAGATGGGETGGVGGSAMTGGSNSGGSVGATGGAAAGGAGGSVGGGGAGGSLGAAGGAGGFGPSCPVTTADADCVCTAELAAAGGAGGTAGAGGAGSADNVCFNFPKSCGKAGDYELLLGSSGKDTWTSADDTGASLWVGLGDDDALGGGYGNDCYLGGDGDDRLEQSGEASTHVMFGGSGTDTFAFAHPAYNQVTIVDFSDGEQIALDWDNFARGSGSAGNSLGVAFETQSSFNAGEPTSIDVRIIYDDTDGEIWWEDGEVSHLVGVIENHAEVTIDESDFVWE